MKKKEECYIRGESPADNELFMYAITDKGGVF